MVLDVVDNPAIVEHMDIDPQPSTSEVQIHISDSESDHGSTRRESEDDSEMLSDSAFIERNVFS